VAGLSLATPVRHAACPEKATHHFGQIPMAKLHTPAALLAAAGLLAACAAPPPSGTMGGAPVAAIAAAKLQPTAGNSATGTVWFAQEGDHLAVRGRVSGLTPNQEHGFHVHERGDCSAADASSAGDHFNPTHKVHGAAHGEGEHHLGDLPSLKADASGTAIANFQLPGVLLGAGANDFMGKALVVHANPDDLRTQPSGNSGPRVGCGVILTPAGQGLGDIRSIPHEM
jgi:Cu-Zn family superoxide dismutase